MGPAAARRADRPQRLTDVRGRLLAARGLRPQPGRDEKVVAAWNGLAIAALAEAGSFFGEPTWVAAAREAAELLVAVHLRRSHTDSASASASDSGTETGARLVRTSRDGVAGAAAGVLEDYACVAEGFLTLAAVTGEPSWVRRAQALLDTVLAEFADGTGLLHDTAAGAEPLIARPRDPADNASPSGTSAAAGALLALGSLTGQARYVDAADRASESVRRLAEAAPRFAGWGLAVLEAAVAGPVQIAVVGAAGDPGRAALHREAVIAVGRGAVAAVGDPGDLLPAAAEGGDPVLALLADRPLVAGSAAAYVCRGFVCDRPVTEVGELRALVSG